MYVPSKFPKGCVILESAKLHSSAPVVSSTKESQGRIALSTQKPKRSSVLNSQEPF